MRPVFDESLKHLWESMSEAGVASMTFYRSHKAMLMLFGEAADWEKVFEGADGEESASEEIRRVAQGSAVGASMLKGGLLRLARRQFQQKAVKKLSDLAHMDYDGLSMRAFTQSMMNKTAALVKLGAKPCERVSTTVLFMGAEVKATVESIDDEWEFRLNALLKTQAFNSGQIQPLPWRGPGCAGLWQDPGHPLVPDRRCEGSGLALLERLWRQPAPDPPGHAAHRQFAGEAAPPARSHLRAGHVVFGQPCV